MTVIVHICPECYVEPTDEPAATLTPTARQHLDAARAALSRPTERRSK